MEEGSSRDTTENLILICIDDCEHSLRAFNWYRKHFYRQEHTIGLVYVYTYPHGDPIQLSSNAEYQRKLHEVLEKSVSVTRKFQELCKQSGITSRVFTEEKVESVGHTICKLAKENHAVCIVMGQRGLGSVRRTIFGSVSDHVLHHAHVTVLIVPPPKGHKYTK